MVASESTWLEDALEEADLPEILAFADLMTRHLPKPVQELVRTRLNSIHNINLIAIPLAEWPSTLAGVERHNPGLLKLAAVQPLNHEELVRTLRGSSVPATLAALRALRKRAEMRSLLDSVVDRLQDPANAAWLRQWAWRSALYQTTKFVFDAERSNQRGLALRVTQALEAIPERLLGEKLVTTPFSFVCELLEFGEKKSPAFLGKCLGQLNRPQHMGYFRHRALLTPLGDLARIMQDGRKRRLTLLVRTVSEALAAPENRSKLAALALSTPLNYTQYFLKCTRHVLPQAHATVVQALAEPANKRDVVELVKRCSLVELTGFMRFANENLPAIVSSVLLDYASDPKNHRSIIEKDLRTPLVTLAPSLAFLKATLPELHQAFIVALPKARPPTSQSA